MIDIYESLKHLVSTEGSELFVTVGYTLSIKKNNHIHPIAKEPPTAPQVYQCIKTILSDKDMNLFEQKNECNCAIDVPNTGRFRISAFLQKGEPGMVIRRISTVIPNLKELGIPIHVGKEILRPKGLILLTGPAGSGKSTTMASLLDYKNATQQGHIILIEDPIEYMHEHKKCIVTQRDVGLDTESYVSGLTNALRQAPNIIAIGEIRTTDVMHHALTAAETGHLCIATLHANNSYQALERIIHFFPLEQRSQILMDLSLNLKAVVSQQLITSDDGNKLYPAVEVMLNNARVADLIKKGDIEQLVEAITKSRELGMQSFDQSLFDMFQEKKISYEQALLHATSSNDLRLMIKMSGSEPPSAKGLNVDSISVSDD